MYLLRSEVQPKAKEFYDYAHELAVGMSQPSIMFKAKLRDGTEIMVDDYREAYWWLRDNTPEDARVMAWWDYGYQITGTVCMEYESTVYFHSTLYCTFARFSSVFVKYAHENVLYVFFSCFFFIICTLLHVM